MSELSERVQEMVNYFSGGVVKRFAREVDTNEANIRNYIKGGSPRFEFLQAVISRFGVSSDWLVMGTGEMLTQKGKEEQEKVPPCEADLKLSQAKIEELLRILEHKDALIKEKDNRIADKEQFIDLLIRQGNSWTKEKAQEG